ncbi:hypothetical protein H0A65_05825 [Alcaligenaceae bacterium]|nr:hypothetical protein [Alcaligenaceae bacterium]
MHPVVYVTNLVPGGTQMNVLNEYASWPACAAGLGWKGGIRNNRQPRLNVKERVLHNLLLDLTCVRVASTHF